MPSLLDELRKHSTIDLDCNDDAVALQYKPFQDMTSNQLIVLGQLKQESHASIMKKAVELAQGAAAQFPGVQLADLAVDFATVLLGKVVAGHLHPTGYVHAQTMTSQAYNKEATVEHALRLVKVYGLAEIPRARVCIKIPSTAEGIAACAELESKHDVRTLATTCFTVAQGLAAGRANCTYVAPYVNLLIVHLDPTKHVVYEDPLAHLTGLQVTFAIQQEYRKLGMKTKVLAASLVTAEEIFALCGIEHITLSANALGLIQRTELNSHFEGIRDRSLAFKKDNLEGPFFGSDLEGALADNEVDALQRDALKHFTEAESVLRAMAEEELRQSRRV